MKSALREAHSRPCRPSKWWPPVDRRTFLQRRHLLLALFLPDPGSGKNWFREMDTSAFLEAAGNIVIPGTEEKIGGAGMTYGLGPRAYS